MFYQDLCRRALLLFIPTILEIVYQDFCRKKPPSFCKSYSTRNILPTFVQKSSNFDYCYSTRIFFFNCSHHKNALILVNFTVMKKLKSLRRQRGFQQCRVPTWFSNDS